MIQYMITTFIGKCCLEKCCKTMHIPERKMRVREKYIPYMNSEWKKAIRMKRKYAQKYAKHRTPENWELKRVWRNIATNERRKAIKAYWKKKADDFVEYVPK